MSSNLIGKVLLNRYRVDAFLASGGMGAVYRVWDLQRNVTLAMKVLNPDLADDPSIIKSFQREAQALKKLAHPNIVAYYGVFRDERLVFLLERFVDGPSLKDVLVQRRGQPLPLMDGLIYLKALCAALGYAHANGVVHCDVKPGNVMIEQGGKIYLADFGIVRHAESTATSLGSVGTAPYMAPEQVRGDPVTPATDVYALGLILFEMLTGQRPFRGNEQGSDASGVTANERIRYAQLHLPPPDPGKLNPAILPAMAHVILKALSKQPEERYASTQDFYSAALLAAGLRFDAIPDRARLGEAVGQAHAATPPTPVPMEQQTPLPSRLARRSWLLPAGIGGAAMLLILVYLLISSDKPVSTLALQPTTAFVESPTQTAVLPPTTTPVPTEKPTATVTVLPSTTATPMPITLSPMSISASGYDKVGSQDSEGNRVTYEPQKAIDGQDATAWRVAGNGTGVWLELNFSQPVTISQVGIIPGYDKIDPFDGTDRFKQNYVVKEVRLVFSDGRSVEFTFDYDRKMQFIQIPNITTHQVRIEILRTYPPTLEPVRKFTPISEIAVFGWP
jgi:serine/threonine protein kinase